MRRCPKSKPSVQRVVEATAYEVEQVVVPPVRKPVRDSYAPDWGYQPPLAGDPEDDESGLEKTADLSSDLDRKIREVIVKYEALPAGAAWATQQEVTKPFQEWAERTFPRLFQSKTPRGGKKVKEDWERFYWTLKNAPSVRGSVDVGVKEIKQRWSEFEAHVPELIRLFSTEGGGGEKNTPTELKTPYATYQNLVGFSAATLTKYVNAFDKILAELKGWRKAALKGDLKIALASKDQFRGTAAGRYNEPSDTMFVRATPKVMRGLGTRAYGWPAYILVHELGHRYEAKVRRIGLSESEWATTRYSRTDNPFSGGNELFAELFALGHFGITSVRSDSFPDKIERFEAMMVRGGRTARTEVDGVVIHDYARIDEGFQNTRLYALERDGSFYVAHVTSGSGLSLDIDFQGSRSQVGRAFQQELSNRTRGVELYSGGGKSITTQVDQDAVKGIKMLLHPVLGPPWGEAASVSDNLEQEDFHRLLTKQLKDWKGSSNGLAVTNHSYWTTFHAMVVEAVKRKYGAKVRVYRGIYGKQAQSVAGGAPLKVHKYSSWAADERATMNYRRDPRSDHWVVVRADLPAKSIALAPVTLPGYDLDPEVLKPLASDVQHSGDELVVFSSSGTVDSKVVRKTSKRSMVERVAGFYGNKRGHSQYPAYFDVCAWNVQSMGVNNQSEPGDFVASTTRAHEGVQSKVVRNLMTPKDSVLPTVDSGGKTESVRSLSFSPSKRNASSPSALKSQRSKGTVERITTKFEGRGATSRYGEGGSGVFCPTVMSTIMPRGTANGIMTSGREKEIPPPQSEPRRVLGPSTKRGIGSSTTTRNPLSNIEWSCQRCLADLSVKQRGSTISTVFGTITDLRTWNCGCLGILPDSVPRTKSGGHGRFSKSTGTSSRKAKSFTIEVGQPVWYSKYKNKRGIVKEFKTGPKGDVIVVIQPVPQGRKQDKEMKLFKIRPRETEEKTAKGLHPEIGTSTHDSDGNPLRYPSVLLRQQRDYGEGGAALPRGEDDEEEMIREMAKRVASKHKDKVPGGLADKKKPSDFDPKQIAKGIKVEMEHTDDRSLAEEIAMDHLTEDGSYYDKLEKMEGGKCAADRVAAKFKNKKEVKKQDGSGTTTVYEYGPRQVADRNKAKAEKVEKLRQSITKLREKVKSDLKSKNDETRLTALAVALMDETYERVGNDESADDGHFGVTGWKVEHLSFKGDTVTISYTGKSAVKHTKKVTNASIVSALKSATDGKGGSAKVLCAGDECDITSKEVNEYLQPFDISAKDIRGFHANREVQERLKAIRAKGPELPHSRKEKDKILKEEFAKAVEEAAKAVGHEPSTLRSQYLVPGMEESYLHDGKVIEKMTDRKASDDNWTWGDVGATVKAFNDLYAKVKTWKSIKTAEKFREAMKTPQNEQIIEAFAYGMYGASPHLPTTALGKWLLLNFDRQQYRELNFVRDAVRDNFDVLRQDLRDPEAFPNDQEVQWAIQGCLEALDDYADKLTSFVSQAAPEKFNYSGFSVENPDHLADPLVRKMLAGADHLIALFKARGMDPALKEGVKKIVLRREDPRGDAHGRYFSDSRHIELYASMTKTDYNRLYKEWVSEVFVHEFGHFIHMSYLHGAAEAEWNKAWAPVEDAKKRQKQSITVTGAERVRYFKLLERNGFVPTKALRKLKGLDTVKFRMWLYKPLLGDSYIVSPKQARLTPHGQRRMEFFRDPYGFTAQQAGYAPDDQYVKDTVRSRMPRFLSGLGVDAGSRSFDYPTLPLDQAEKIYGQEVEAAIDALEVPTGYARTNKLEDFAETFTAFMLNPSRLSDQAKFRMQRALAVSGLYGKQVMRLAGERENVLAWIDSHGDPLTLYREVYVSDPSRIRKEKLGRFWTPNKKKAHSPFGKLDNKPGRVPVIVAVQAPKSAINIDETVATVRRYPGEEEIRLSEGASVKLLGYEVGGTFHKLSGTGKVGTKSPAEREDEEAERLVRQDPDKKPPRGDLRRRRMEPEEDRDEEADKDASVRVAVDFLMRVANGPPPEDVPEEEDTEKTPSAPGNPRWPTKGGPSNNQKSKLFVEFMREEGDKRVQSPTTGNDVKLKSLKGPEGEKIVKREFELWLKERKDNEEKNQEPKPTTRPEEDASGKDREDAPPEDPKPKKEPKKPAPKKPAPKKPKKEPKPYVLNDKPLSGDDKPPGPLDQAARDEAKALRGARVTEAYDSYLARIEEAKFRDKAQEAEKEGEDLNPDSRRKKKGPPDPDEEDRVDPHKLLKKIDKEARMLTRMRKELPDGSPRAMEIDGILTGMALAAAQHGFNIPGRPKVPKPLATMAELLHKNGDLHFLASVSDFTSPEGREAISNAFGAMDDKQFAGTLGGEDGPFGEAAKLLMTADENKRLKPNTKVVLRDILSNLMVDRISLIEPLIAEHLEKRRKDDKGKGKGKGGPTPEEAAKKVEDHEEFQKLTGMNHLLYGPATEDPHAKNPAWEAHNDGVRRRFLATWLKLLDLIYGKPGKKSLARETAEKAVREGMGTANVYTDPPLVQPRTGSRLS